MVERATEPQDLQENLHIKTPDELPDGQSLSAKVDEIMDNRRLIFLHNLEVLRKRNHIRSQAIMCTQTLEGLLQSSQLSNLKSPDKSLSFRTAAIVATAFNVPVEALTGEVMDHRSSFDRRQANRPVEEYQKYLGTYSLAYFDTSQKPGANTALTPEAIKHGVLTVYMLTDAFGSPSFHVDGLFNCNSSDYDTIRNLLSTCDFTTSLPQVKRHYKDLVTAVPDAYSHKSRTKCLYSGDLRLTDQMAELNLHQVSGPDSVHILMHNRAAGSSEGKSYRGGLATMMSMSRGAEHEPCIQSLLISDSAMDNCADEEIADLLYMQPPALEFDDAIEEIITYMRWLFAGDGSQSAPALSDEDRAYCLKSFVAKKLTDIVRRNYVSYYKVSLDMDSDVYRTLLRLDQKGGKNHDQQGED